MLSYYHSYFGAKASKRKKQYDCGSAVTIFYAACIRNRTVFFARQAAMM